MRQLKISNQITVRNQSIEKYFNDIALIPLITPDEEVELAVRIQSGDDVALGKLVRANLRFVVSVAKQYAGSNPKVLAELINEGNIGLIKAARKFDETRGFKFISYAVWWVRQAILEYLGKNFSEFKVTARTYNDYKKAERFQENFYNENSREPTIYEIADHLGIHESSVPSILRLKSVVQGDSAVGEGSPNSIFDTIEGKDDMLHNSINNEHTKKVLFDIIDRLLSNTEGYILKSFFGMIGDEEKNLSDIGKEIGLTRERVRQIKEKAVRKIRRYMLKTKIEY